MPRSGLVSLTFHIHVQLSSLSSHRVWLCSHAGTWGRRHLQLYATAGPAVRHEWVRALMLCRNSRECCTGTAWMAYCAALMASAALVVAHTFCGSSNPCVQAGVVMQIGLALLMQLQQGQVQTRSSRSAALCWTDLLDATMSLTTFRM